MRSLFAQQVVQSGLTAGVARVVCWCVVCSRSAPSFMNVLVLHDMIPELFGWDMGMPEWVGKRMAIDAYVVLHALWSCQAVVLTSWGLFRRADAVVFVSQTTRADFLKLYAPHGDGSRARSRVAQGLAGGVGDGGFDSADEEDGWEAFSSVFGAEDEDDEDYLLGGGGPDIGGGGGLDDSDDESLPLLFNSTNGISPAFHAMPEDEVGVQV